MKTFQPKREIGEENRTILKRDLSDPNDFEEV